MERSTPEAQSPPTHCPTCNIEFAVDFECGKYVILKCSKCGLTIRSFPPEPLAAYYEKADGDRTADLARLLAARIDREPPKVEIPMFDLDDLDSDLD